jgi:hypothetical protein
MMDVMRSCVKTSKELEAGEQPRRDIARRMGLRAGEEKQECPPPPPNKLMLGQGASKPTKSTFRIFGV